MEPVAACFKIPLRQFVTCFQACHLITVLLHHMKPVMNEGALRACGMTPPGASTRAKAVPPLYLPQITHGIVRE